MDEDKKAREAKRIKTQLMILAVMMVLVVVANRKKIAELMGSRASGAVRNARARTATGQKPGRATSPARRGSRTSTASRSAPAPRRSSGGGLTPYQIPKLSQEVISRLGQKGIGGLQTFDEKKLLTGVNPFTPFEYDYKRRISEIGGGGPRVPAPARSATPPGPAAGGGPPSSLRDLRYLGRVQRNGRVHALLKKEGSIVPRAFPDGSRLDVKEGDYRLRILPDGQIRIEDTGPPAPNTDRTWELLPGQPPRPIRQASAVQPGWSRRGADTGGYWDGLPPRSAPVPVPSAPVEDPSEIEEMSLDEAGFEGDSGGEDEVFELEDASEDSFVEGG